MLHVLSHLFRSLVSAIFFLFKFRFILLFNLGVGEGMGVGGTFPSAELPQLIMGSRNQKLVPLEEQQMLLPTMPSVSPVSILLMLWNEFQDSRCTPCEWDTTEVNPARECN